MNVAEQLVQAVIEHGWSDRLAVIEDSQTWTHGQTHETAARVASVLKAEGVGRGDCVMIALPDGFAWVATFLAAARLGAVAVLVNPSLAEREHKRMADIASPSLVVCREELDDRFHKTLHPDELLRSAERSRPRPVEDVSSDHPLYIQFTSGTTGAPKGAVHRHSDLEVYARTGGVDVVWISETDVTLSVSKLYFAYGFANSFAYPFFSGAAVVLMPQKPSAAAVGELIARHGVTILYAVPSFFASMLEVCEPSSCRSLRVAVSAGEHLNGALAGNVERLLSCPILNQLGSTDAGSAFCSNTLARRRAGTVGVPLDGFEIRIVDGSGNDVGLNVAGQLLLRGPTVLVEYLGDPKATEAALVDGWFHSGDRVKRHADGFISHLGRMDDLEMVGGITIAPQEIEELIEEHEAVDEAVVVAIETEQGRSELHAVIVTDRGHSIVPTLVSRLREQLAPFKIPRRFHVWDRLPRTPSGKKQRFAVRHSLASQTDTTDSQPAS